MDGTVNIILVVWAVGTVAIPFCAWFGPRSCAFIGEYFTARSVALPRKRKAIWDARHQYRQDMEMRHKGPAEVTELKRGKA